MASVIVRALCLGLLLSLLAGTDSRGQLPISKSVGGGEFTYVVEKGDTLTGVGARFGIAVPTLAELNGYDSSAWLRLGQALRINNTHIVPRVLNEGIVINIPQRMLFYFHSSKLVAAYPASLGRRTWQTPEGNFEVLEKEKDKTWIVPKSIQEEMLKKGETVREEVPPGPDNPLGRHWIRIAATDGIHGTNTPASIYGFRTHGCIRLMPENIASLFKEVSIGTPVRIVYQPVLLARLPDGELYLEVHPDVYRKAGDPLTVVTQMAETASAESMIDWQKVRKVIGERRGLAEKVSRSQGTIFQETP